RVLQSDLEGQSQREPRPRIEQVVSGRSEANGPANRWRSERRQSFFDLLDGRRGTPTPQWLSPAPVEIPNRNGKGGMLSARSEAAAPKEDPLLLLLLR